MLSAYAEQQRQAGFKETLANGSIKKGEMTRPKSLSSPPSTAQLPVLEPEILLLRDPQSEPEETKESREKTTLGEGLNNILHEVRGSLHGIYGSVSRLESINDELTELLSDGDPNNISPSLRQRMLALVGTREKVTQSIDSDVEQEKSLINDALTFSKLEEGKLALAFSLLDPQELIKAIIGQLQHEASKKKLLITPILIPKEMAVYADRDKLRLILLHLISYAIKTSAEGGKITIKFDHPEIAPETTILKFSIQDNSEGMTEEEIEKIFIPRFQENILSPELGVDSRFGLSICEQLIMLMQGTITINSHKGNGSTFNCTITCPNNPKLVVPPSSPVILPQKKPKLVNQNNCALVVDDSQVNQKILKKVLEAAGFSCILANNGQEAVDLFKKKTFCIILMDCNMPIMGGLAATQLIRQEEREKNPQLEAPIPIIITSGEDQTPEFTAKLIQQGATDYLGKPFKPQDVLTKIAEHTAHVPIIRMPKSRAF